MKQYDNDVIFRAYLPATGKGSNIRYKNVPSEQLPSFSDIDKPSVKDVTGLLQTNALIVDADNYNDDGEPEQLINDLLRSEVIDYVLQDKEIPTMIVETENEGEHFYFLNNDENVEANHQNINTAIGVPVDFKIGMNNGTAKIKGDGVFRTVIQETDKFVELPKWLTPIKTDIDFSTLKAGDGRNQTLFNYIITLQSNGFTPDEARETLQIINDYVLPDPLDQSELESIYRDEAFAKPVFYNGKTFLFNKFGDYLKSEHSVKRIGGRLHIYRGGVYIPSDAAIENAMLNDIPSLRKAQRSEVLSYLNVRSEAERVEPSDPELILFRNGVYNIKTNELLPNSPEYIITNKINWDYNPNAYHEEADDTLNKIACNDDEIRMLLEEVIGSTLYRSTAFGKAFILTGEKSNGKSTFLYIINKILGEENISALDLNELGDRFKTAELFGKLANIGDDIDNAYISDTGIFKKLVTGDRINVERKGLDPFDFYNYSKLLFSANEMPRIGKGGEAGAIFKRLLIIPFNATFSKDDEGFNPFIKTDLTKQAAIEYFIKIGIEGLKRILMNNGFTIPDQVKKQVKEYELENDSVGTFLNNLDDIDEILNESTNEVHLRYSSSLSSEQYPVSLNKFTRRLGKYGIITMPVNGTRVYVKE